MAQPGATGGALAGVQAVMSVRHPLPGNPTLEEASGPGWRLDPAGMNTLQYSRHQSPVAISNWKCIIISQIKKFSPPGQKPHFMPLVGTKARGGHAGQHRHRTLPPS